MGTDEPISNTTKHVDLTKERSSTANTIVVDTIATLSNMRNIKLLRHIV